MRGNFLVKSILLPLMMVLSVACQSEGNTRIKRIGLKPIEIRDSKAGSGQGEDDPEDPDAPPVVTDPQDSVAAFSLVLYPKLTEYCGQCHAVKQPPLFAAADKKVAHDSLIATSKVDFKDINQSRIVLRVSKENHNCPDGDCIKAVTAFTDGIAAWVAKLNSKEEDGPKLPLTAVLKFADANDSVIKGENPPGIIYLEAEKGTLKAPMVGVSEAAANGGLYVHTPLGSGNQNNVATATTQVNLGTIIYSFDVTVDGTYQVNGRIGSPGAATNGFYVRVDGGAFQTWQFPQTNADLIWDKADPVVGAGTPITFALTPGAHTMEIRQRREQARIDALVLSSDPGFDPMNASKGDEAVKKLSFDIGDISGVPGAKLAIYVADYSDNAYIFRNPTIELPAGAKIKAKNMKLLINGKYLPQHATYTVVDSEVTGPAGLLSGAALVALKDKGNVMDEFSFEFETLQKVP